MDAAIKAYNDALALFKAVGSRLGEANTLKAIGDVHQFKKELDAAIKAYNDALALFKAVGDRLGEANTLKAFGQLYHAEKKFDKARANFEAAIAGHAAIRDRYSVAVDLYYFSFTQESLGQVEAAIKSVELALQTCLQLNLPWTEMAVSRLFDLKKMPETDFQNYLAGLAQQWGLP
ncbi:tetratricopeptide repeat protein [candidate division KSB1 bacterium]|nr:MAG: tetratricopeptide repeat protein [candidate division KSB1 bacterium]